MSSRLTFDALRPRVTDHSAIAIGLLLVALGTSQLAADAPRHDDERQSVVLLTNGETLSGIVTRSRDHVEIRQPGRRIKLSRSRVQWIGDSVEAVYRYRERHLSSQSAPAHLRLACWCLEQQLYDQAARHFATAQHADPNHPEIEPVRQRLLRCWARDKTSPQLKSTDAGRSTSHGPFVRTASFSPATTAREADPRIDKAAMRSFTHQVQPLLINRCGTSGCHGANSTSRFQLSDPRWKAGSVATMTRQNLRAVLQQLHSQRPDTSPLLAQARVAHGVAAGDRHYRRHRELAEASLQTDQLQLLREWILKVSGGGRPSMVAAQPVTAELERPGAVADPFDPREFNKQTE